MFLLALLSSNSIFGGIFSIFCVEITPLANSLFHWFLSYADTIYFLCSPYALSGTFSTILNRHACQASHLGGKVFTNKSHVSHGLVLVALTMLKYISLEFRLLKAFWKELCWVLPSLRWPCGFVFHLVNIVWNIYWLLLNDTCI